MTEERPFTTQESHKAFFVQLVMMLSGSALQQMGKLVDPQTHKANVDLEVAQATIDMLDMLEAKTKGNLDKEEERMIRDTLMSLKLNFVETKEASGVKPPPSDKPQPPPTVEDKKSDSIEDKGPKFHKKY